MLDKIRSASKYEIMNYPNNSYLSLSSRFKLYLKNLIYRRKKDKFFWPNGLIAIGLGRDYIYCNNSSSYIQLEEYINTWINKGLKINNLDNVINGYSLLLLYEKSGDKKYLDAINTITDYILEHPTNVIGSFPYRDNILDVYADGIGMVPPYLCRLGKITKNKELIDLGVLQIKNFLEYGMSELENLPYHSYNIEENIKKGIVGWGRAVGWLLLGMIDSIEYIPQSHQDYEYLIEKFNSILNTTVSFQNGKGYFHWQLSALEGPIDTSATSMIIYAIDRGIEMKIISESYLSNVQLGISALSMSTIDGYVYDSSAECLGLGLYPQKYSQYPWSLGLTLSIFSRNDCS